MDLAYCIPSLHIPTKIAVAPNGESSRHYRKAGYVHYAEFMWASSSKWRPIATIFAQVLLRDDATGAYARASPIGKRNFLLYFITWSTNWRTAHACVQYVVSLYWSVRTLYTGCTISLCSAATSTIASGKASTKETSRYDYKHALPSTSMGVHGEEQIW